MGGPGLVVWGLGQPFERYAPPSAVAMEHARQCVVRAHVLSLQWGPPGSDATEIIYEAQRLGRPLRSVDLSIVNQIEPVVEDIAIWLRSKRPHLYVVGGEQASPQSLFYQRTYTLLFDVLNRFPQPNIDESPLRSVRRVGSVPQCSARYHHRCK